MGNRIPKQEITQKKSTAQGGVSYCGGSGWIVIPNANTFASGPFHCALRACSEPNNLTIVCPNPYTTAQNKNRPTQSVCVLVGVGGFEPPQA